MYLNRFPPSGIRRTTSGQIDISSAESLWNLKIKKLEAKLLVHFDGAAASRRTARRALATRFELTSGRCFEAATLQVQQKFKARRGTPMSTVYLYGVVGAIGFEPMTSTV